MNFRGNLSANVIFSFDALVFSFQRTLPSGGKLFEALPLHCLGGADRVRTDDIRLAKPALSQLSYSPVDRVGLGRFELPTSRLSGVRSNQLSYRPGLRTLKTEQQDTYIESRLTSRTPFEEAVSDRVRLQPKLVGTCAVREGVQKVLPKKQGLLKGGDPAAGSPTATLLRLHPSRYSDLRRLPPEG